MVNARRIMTNYVDCRTPEDSNGAEIQQSITLMWISVLYVVCQSPKIIPDFYEALYCEYSSVRMIVHYLRLYISCS